jgi:hypothetical protein
LALAACVADDGAERTGHIALAVVAAGPDGATYRLPQGTILEMQPGYSFPLDGDGAIVTVQLSPGTYDAWLFASTASGAGSLIEWPLDRIAADGSVDSVNATLVTSQPAPVTVVAGQTTPLVLEFRIATGGTVRFERGDVAVSIDVGGTPATAFTASAQGTFGTTSLQSTALFVGRLPGNGATGLSLSVTGAVTGAWQEAGGDPTGGFYICAPLTVTARSGSGSTGFADFVEEVGIGDAPNYLFGPANVCVVDYGALGNAFRVRLTKQGAGTTPTFADITDGLFSVVLFGTLSEKVYDYAAGTFDLDALMRAHTQNLNGSIRASATAPGGFYLAGVSGQMTFSLVGQ